MLKILAITSRNFVLLISRRKTTIGCFGGAFSDRKDDRIFFWEADGGKMTSERYRQIKVRYVVR